MTKKQQTDPFIDSVLEEGVRRCKTLEDVSGFIKSFWWPLIERMLEAEMENHLGYTKHDIKWYNSWNSRNWTYSKRLRTTEWDLTINVPRDRNWEFEPQVVQKYKWNMGELEEKIINMYGLWLSTRDIEEHVKDIYGATISPSMVSTITDKILPLVEEWKSRPLKACYPVIFLDAIRCKVKENEVYVDKSVYMVVWYSIEGYKDVLWFYIWNQESSKFRHYVCNDLVNRWVKDICIACIDWLPGFSEAIKKTFPQSEIQRCIVHQIRHSLKYVSNNDKKEFMADMAKMYKAVNISAAEVALDKFSKKRGKTYSISVNSWVNNRADLSTYFVYPELVRKVIYTTNIIESNNAKIRTVVKKWRVFPHQKSLEKLMFLAIKKCTKKRTAPMAHWWKIITQLHGFFPEILDKYLY